MRATQFDEGNLLQAPVDWQLGTLNEQTDLNAGVTIVRPISADFPPSLNTQDGLHITLIHELDEQGGAVSEVRLIRSVNNEINPYQDFVAYLTLAHNAEIRLVFLNTTEAGASYYTMDHVDDVPPMSFPAKLARLLLERFNHFADTVDKGQVIILCGPINHNGEALKTLVLWHAQEW